MEPLVIRLNPSNEIRVQLESFQGVESIDLRRYCSDEEGEFYPTKKGVKIDIKYIDKLIDFLNNVKKDKSNERNSS